MVKQRKQVDRTQQSLGEAVREVTNVIPSNVKYIVLWIVGLAALFLILSYAFPILFKLIGVGTVNYGGLSFTKEVLGQGANQIIMYHYFYLYKDAQGQLVQNNIYLRNNPSEIKAQVNADIIFVQNAPISIAIDTDNLVSCNQSSIAIGELSSFIKNSGNNVSAGTLNKTEALDKNIAYADCGLKNDSITIRVILGNASRIDGSVNVGCYQISASSCQDLLPTTEKFIVQSIIDAKNRSNSTSSYVQTSKSQ